MTKTANILSEINNRYFWDVDSSKLDPESSKRLIIERVFCLGGVKDMKTIIAYYGTDEILQQLTCLPYLDSKTLNFISVLFDKPKEEFRCHNNNRSPRQRWNS